MKHSLALKFLCVLVMSMVCQSCSAKNVFVELTIVDAELANGRLVIEAIIHNNTDREITFLPWNTPFDKSVNGPILDIIDIETSEQIEYVGRSVKRRAPTLNDYLHVPSGEKVMSTLDYTDHYIFCANGRYQIITKTNFYTPGHEQLKVDSNVLTVELAGLFNAC